jgi:hypothetical protein
MQDHVMACLNMQEHWLLLFWRRDSSGSDAMVRELNRFLLGEERERS